jgi:hypothetical protein
LYTVVEKKCVNYPVVYITISLKKHVSRAYHFYLKFNDVKSNKNVNE